MASINTIFRVFFVFVKLLEAAVQTCMGNEFKRKWNRYFKGSKHCWTIIACVAVRPSVLVTVKPDINPWNSYAQLCTVFSCIIKYLGCEIMCL